MHIINILSGAIYFDVASSVRAKLRWLSPAVISSRSITLIEMYVSRNVYWITACNVNIELVGKEVNEKKKKN